MPLDSDIKNEVFEDFKKLFSSIDFKNYRPNSPEFQNALHVGLMWKLLSELSENNETSIEVETDEQKYTDDISDELSDVKKYLKKFIETSDIQFKQMAVDELRHAGILIKKERIKNAGEPNEKLDRYEFEQKDLTMKLM